MDSEVERERRDPVVLRRQVSIRIEHVIVARRRSRPTAGITPNVPAPTHLGGSGVGGDGITAEAGEHMNLSKTE